MFHQSFYSPSQQPPLFHNNRIPNHFFMPAQSSFYPPGSRLNRSSRNLNLSRDFQRIPMPPHGFTSMPKGPYPFYDLTRWRQHMARIQQQNRQKPAFYFQDKSTFYYMSDPIITNDNRITIQLTKVHIGLNGDQQRVFVEQDFSNENEFKNFVKNFKYNFEKTFHNHDENQKTDKEKPSVIVIEEPDEEPKIYNENIKSSFINRDRHQRLPLISSVSTIRSNQHRRNKRKYHQQNRKSPDYQPPPPKFQQPFNNRSRLYNENVHSSRFARHLQDPYQSQFHRTQQQQPTTIGANLIFTNNKQQQQPRVHHSRSELRSKIPFRNRNKRIHQFLNYRQGQFIPVVLPSTHLLYRNTQIQFRLFNLYPPNSKHF